MAKPLGIPLGIDFQKLDADLNKVANHIEELGKKTHLQLGSGGTTPVDTAGLAGTIGDFGLKLSQGLSAGIRSSSALMLGFAAHIDSILNRVGGAAITLFKRVDSYIKFPAWDTFWKTTAQKFGQIAATGKKPISDLDKAISGTFGALVQRIAKLFRDLFADLGKTIAESIKGGIAHGEASVNTLFADISRKKAEIAKFPMGKAGLATSIPGPRIGAKTDFLTPKPVVPLELGAKIGTEAAKLLRVLGEIAYVPVRITAALAAMGSSAVGSFRRVLNFFSTLGPVTKKTVDDMYRSGLRLATLGIFGKADSDAKSFNSTMGAAKSSVGQVTGAVRTLGTTLLAAFGVVGVLYKLVTFFKEGIKGASDLSDTVKVSKGIFGDSFGAINAQVDSVSKKYGIMRNEQLKIANGFGAMGQGAGLTERASASLANKMTALTFDFAKTWQIPFTEASDKIQQGLAGQGRGLKEYGVFLDDDTTKAVAMARGAGMMGQALSKSDNLVARAAILMNGLSYATGALERTSGGASDQFRRAGGGVSEFGVRIGEILLPAVKLGTEAFNTLLGATLDVFESGKGVIDSWMAGIVSAMGKVAMVARNLGDIWKIVQLRIGEFVINSIETMKTMPENFGRIWEWLKKNWLGLLEDMLANLKQFAINLTTNAANIGKALWEALQTGEFKFEFTDLTKNFQKTTDALPEMIKPKIISVQQEVDNLWKGIEAKEAKIKPFAETAIKKPGPLEEKKTTEYKLAGAVEVGSKEASSILAKSSALGRGPANKQVELLKNSVDVQKQILDETRKKGPAITVK